MAIPHAAFDEQIGQNLARLRGEMSQAALGDLMRSRGFKWSQATVWAVEKGDRPLRLSEALAINDLLDVPVNELWRHSADVVLEWVIEAYDEHLAATLQKVQQMQGWNEALAGHVHDAEAGGASPEVIAQARKRLRPGRVEEHLVQAFQVPARHSGRPVHDKAAPVFDVGKSKEEAALSRLADRLDQGRRPDGEHQEAP